MPLRYFLSQLHALYVHLKESILDIFVHPPKELLPTGKPYIRLPLIEHIKAFFSLQEFFEPHQKKITLLLFKILLEELNGYKLWLPLNPTCENLPTRAAHPYALRFSKFFNDTILQSPKINLDIATLNALQPDQLPITWIDYKTSHFYVRLLLQQWHELHIITLRSFSSSLCV